MSSPQTTLASPYALDLSAELPASLSTAAVTMRVALLEFLIARNEAWLADPVVASMIEAIALRALVFKIAGGVA